MSGSRQRDKAWHPAHGHLPAGARKFIRPIPTCKGSLRLISFSHIARRACTRLRTAFCRLCPGNATLGHAIYNRDHALALRCIQEGANPNGMFRTGDTPLLMALRLKNFEGARILLENGADPNLPGRCGMPPLCDAAFQGLAGFCRELLLHGARPDLRDDQGRSALWHASSLSDDRGICGLLLQSGANPNLCDYSGTYPIHNAASASLALCQALISCGADPSPSRKFAGRRQSPAQIARSACLEEAAQFLEAAALARAESKQLGRICPSDGQACAIEKPNNKPRL